MEEVKWKLNLISKHVSGEDNMTWKLTNVYSKPFIVWGASHFGVADGYQVSVLDKNRVLEPGESIELLTRHRSRAITLSCTEYDTSEEAYTAYAHNLANPEKYHGELEWDIVRGHKPVFPFQWCNLTLDYWASPVISDCHLSETYRPATIVIKEIDKADKLRRNRLFRRRGE